MSLRVALVRTDLSEGNSALIIRVTGIGELGTTIPVILMMEVLRSPKRRFLKEPYGVTSQKTAFFIVISVITSNLT
jgi:hypothetical protein